MKIIALRTENIKNIKAVEINPGDGSVLLTGKNGAGKSAVLDSIMMALTNQKIEQPIRNGQNRAEINIDMGAYKVKRVYTDKGGSLKVTNAEGMPFTSPQKMLDEIMGNLSFDPLKFAELGKNVAGQREQRNILAKLVGIDFAELNAEREALFNERTIKHRLLKGSDMATHRADPNSPLPLEARVAKLEIPDISTPRQEISMGDALANVENLEAQRNEYLEKCRNIEAQNKEADRNHAAKVEKLNSDIEAGKKRLNTVAQEIEQLKKMLNDKAAQLDEITVTISQAENALAAVCVPEHQLYPAETVTEAEISQAREAIKGIEEQNDKIRKAIEYDKSNAELAAVRKDIADLEARMTKIDLEKQDKVNNAQFPIPGLGITDQCVVFNDKPFSQLSTGEQIRVSTAVAMALNPTLRVILIRDASLLDQSGMNEIINLAKEKDYQCWLEKVSDEKGVGVYIEDGEIK